MTDDRASLPSRSWRPRHISIWTIILALLTVITFLAIASKDAPYGVRMMGLGGYTTGYDTSNVIPPSVPTAAPMPMHAVDAGVSESGMAYAKDAAVSNASMMAQGVTGGMGGGVSANYAYAPDYYPYPGGGVPASDTRELQKVYYNASMQARDVAGLTRRVETTVRGYDGRVDQISSSPQSGYVSFVVPVTKYDAFRNELESLVNSRFLTIDISSSNMLPQKQSIEEQQKQASSTLADYQTSRSKLVKDHASTVASLQSQINADADQLALLRAQTGAPDIQYQIQKLTDEWSLLKQRLLNENTSYKYQLDTIESNIKYTQDWQKAIGTQDQKLMDDVATVNGSVSIQWISLSDMVLVYLPGYWIPAIFALLTILSFLYDRRRFGTV
ncbi:hypothetical protein HZC00_03370 [Candidatus Kaiserbacteria bacterium]|nr:hypothetical protein [Candidatus Kaiserbacteria bacterium]